MNFLKDSLLVVFVTTVVFWLAPSLEFWQMVGLLLGLYTLISVIVSATKHFALLAFLGVLFRRQKIAEQETAQVVALIKEAQQSTEPLEKVREAILALAEHTVTNKRLLSGELFDAEREFTKAATENPAMAPAAMMLKDALLSYVLQKRVVLEDGRVATPVGWVKDGELLEGNT